MSKESEKRLGEWAIWYHKHKDDNMSIDSRLEFLTVALDGCLEICAMQAQDIQDLENRKREIEASNLVIPVKRAL